MTDDIIIEKVIAALLKALDQLQNEESDSAAIPIISDLIAQLRQYIQPGDSRSQIRQALDALK